MTTNKPFILEPKLIFNNGYRWESKNGVFFKGFFHDQSGRFFQGTEALERLQAVNHINELVELLKQLHGSFAIIISNREEIFIAVDQMSLFPVFYTDIGNRWVISDSVSELLKQKTQWHVNMDAIPEFRSAGFVMGNETLVEDVFRVKPGEVISLSNASHVKNKGPVQATVWHYFLPKGFFSPSNINALEKAFLRALDRVIEKLSFSTKGRTLVLPLSGGYDSRLIACMLKKAGIQNVICITYGKPNPESKLSELVAKRLGYQWIFIDYSRIHTSGFLNDPMFHNYCDYAGNHTSMPYLQEYFAVKHLKDKQLIPDNSIFLPGHSGDFLGGSYVDIAAKYSGRDQDVSSHIASIYFPFLPLSRYERNRIEKRLIEWLEACQPPAYHTEKGYCPTVEDWDVKEKLAKFIFNSSSVFPYFGYEIRFPLWDSEMQAFFRKLPYNLRSQKIFYDKTLEDKFFKPMNAYFGDDELNASERSLKNTAYKLTTPQSFVRQVKRWAKRFTPFYLIEKRMRKNDWICYQKFTKEMVNEMKREGCAPPKRFNRYNALICEWYLCTINKNYKTTQLNKCNPKP